MAEIDERLRAIEDRFAILDLESRYAETWDFGQAEDWATLFTEDGEFQMLAVGNIPHARVNGHAQLREFCIQISQHWRGLHFMHPPRLDLDGDVASSLIYFEFRHVMHGGDAHVRQGMTAGHYRTRYRRTPHGWRIRSRMEQAVFEELGHAYKVTPSP